MKTSEFDYELPPEFIAQTPIDSRDHSRLLVISRDDDNIEHHHFYNLADLLQSGDLLVFNDSRVLPARLYGRRESGGTAEILLLHRLNDGTWDTLVRPGRKVRIGDIIEISSDNGNSVSAQILERKDGGIRTIRFSDESQLDGLGQVPLPPYITTPLDNPERYQTVYSKVRGSTAAPTAGLHFTPDLLNKLDCKGIEFAFVTLHVGLDTFRPIRVDDPHEHVMHKEYGILGRDAAQMINKAKSEGRRVISVGTTSVRILEGAAAYARDQQIVAPFDGWVDTFILPGFEFRVVDALITNFHLPKSTLLMLVSAFASKQLMLTAYEEAIRENYRFYSFGDAMLIV